MEAQPILFEYQRIAREQIARCLRDCERAAKFADLIAGIKGDRAVLGFAIAKELAVASGETINDYMPQPLRNHTANGFTETMIIAATKHRPDDLD